MNVSLYQEKKGIGIYILVTQGRRRNISIKSYCKSNAYLAIQRFTQRLF